MMTRFAVLTAAFATLLVCGTASAAECDRACLNGIVEKYIAAMAAHDPSKAPIAKGTRYSENGVSLTLPDGIWRTVGSIGVYRLIRGRSEAQKDGFKEY